MMTTTVTGDGSVEVVVDGTVGADDVAALRRTIEEEAQRHGPVRLLTTVRRFGGVSAAGLREDLKSLGLAGIIARNAVVTDVRLLRVAVNTEFAILPVEGRAFADRAAAIAWLEG